MDVTSELVKGFVIRTTFVLTDWTSASRNG